ncbi:collagen-binding domain-containing protein [Micromonospora profundi]|uniref:DUF7507 domain-containing protein n=1 Tax=Micromonospora profundi TaxID=1420889 RepID=UPI003A913CAC
MSWHGSRGSRMAALVAVGGLLAVSGPPVPAVAAPRPVNQAAVAAAIGPLDPVAEALSFGVMTEGNANLGSGENEGTLAAGGDLTFGNYQVAAATAGSFVVPGDANPSALVVGGRVNFAGSIPGTRLQVLNNGYAKVGDLTGAFVRNIDNNGAQVNTRILPADNYDASPRVELVTRQPVDSVGPTSPINFTEAFAAFRATSSGLATCNNTMVLRTPEGEVLPRPIPPGSNAVVTLTPGVTNVLDLTATDLANIAVLTFADAPTAATPLLVNVDTSGVGDTFDWTAPNFAGIGGPQAPYILFNFPTATALTLTPEAATVEGTIYAPNATFTKLSATNAEGTIITRTLDHRGGEIHYFPFSTTLSCQGAAPADIALIKSTTTTTITTVGQQVPYTFLVINTGGVPLTGVTITDVQTPPSSNDNLGPITCAATTLAPGAQTECTATYTVTQADLDNGSVTDTATAQGTPPTGPPVVSEPDTETIPVEGLTADISVVKSTTTTSITSVGQEVPYTFLVVNTGSVTLRNVTVNDTVLPPSERGVLGPITCGPQNVPNGTVVLAPGESVQCRATYTVTEEDFAGSSLRDVATVTGAPPSGPSPVSPPSPLDIPIPHPAIAIDKSVTPTVVSAAGDVVTYRFVVSNTGTTTLNSVTIEETAFSGTGTRGTITCGTPPVANGSVTLAPGESVTCTSRYTVTAADVEAGRITNTAVAVGTPPTTPGQEPPGPVRSEPDSSEVTARPGAAGITVVKSSTTHVITRPGQEVPFQFVVTNTGQVTLTDVTVTDTPTPPASSANLGPITCGPDRTPNGSVTLAAGAVVTCTATYTVSKADIRNGSVRNTATATGTPPQGPAPVSPESTISIRVKGMLPVTGESLPVNWMGAGVLAVLLGAALLLVARQRRIRA